MNLMLHHLRKEIRFLLHLWLPWVVLLGVGVAVDVEWIAPLQAAGVKQSWNTLLPMLISLTAVALACSSAPEDAPSQEDRFIATRPLPQSSYWLARGLVALLMLWLPLVLQEVLSLAIAKRPVAEIVNGAMERGLMVGALLGMLIPFYAFWKRRQFMLAAGLVVGCYVVSGKVMSFVMLKWWSVIPPYYSHRGTELWGNWLMALLLMGLLALHLRQQWSLRTRLIMTAALPFLAQILWVTLPVQRSIDVPEDQARVDRESREVKVDLPMLNMTLSDRGSDKGLFYHQQGRASFEKKAGNLKMDLLPQKIRLRQDGRELKTKLFPTQSRYEFFEGHVLPSAEFLPGFPANTILIPASSSIYTKQVAMGRIEIAGMDANREVEEEVEFDLAWAEIEKVVDLPLKVGASAELADARWTVLAVQPHTDNQGRPLRGALSLQVKVERSTQIQGKMPTDWFYRGRYMTVLHAPERKVAWVDSHARRVSTRELSSWKREVQTLTWRNVLTYVDNKDAKVNVENVRFNIFQKRYLGKSNWAWRPTAFVPGNHFDAENADYFWHGSLYQGDQRRLAFYHRLAQLQIPDAKAPEGVVREYLCAVMLAGFRLGHSPPDEESQVWSAALRPVAKHHLPLLLSLPQRLVPPWSPVAQVVKEVVNDTHKNLLFEHLKDQPWLAQVILMRGWQAEAKQAVADQLQKVAGKLSNEVITLMMTWNDPATIRRMVEDQLQWPNFEIYKWLRDEPGLQPAMDAMGRSILEKWPPISSGMKAEVLMIAISNGSRDALEQAFHLCAEWNPDGKIPVAYAGQLIRFLQPLTDLPPLKFGESEDRLIRAFRELKAADYDYDASQRTWHRRAL